MVCTAAGDDFNRPDSAALGALWAETKGNLDVAANTLRNGGTAADNLAVWQCGRPFDSVTVSADLTFNNGGGSMLMGARLGGFVGGLPTRGYAVEVLSTGRVILWRVNNWTQLGVYTITGYTPGTAYRIALRAVGNNLSVDVNGVTRITATNGAYASGDVGLWSYRPARVGAHQFDDFLVQVGP